MTNVNANAPKLEVAIMGFGRTIQAAVKGMGENRLVVLNSREFDVPPQFDPCVDCEHAAECPKGADGMPIAEETRFLPCCPTALSWRATIAAAKAQDSSD